MTSSVVPRTRPHTAVSGIRSTRLQYAFIQCDRCATTFVCSGTNPSIRCPRTRVKSAKDLPWIERSYSRHCELCGVYNDTACDELTSRCVHSKVKKPPDFWSCMLQLPECCKRKVYKNYDQMWHVVVSCAGVIQMIQDHSFTFNKSQFLL